MEYNNEVVKPDSWLVWSILATILCCLPFGIVGIVFASKVDGLWNSGQQQQAVAMAKKARTWTIVAIAAGVAGALIYGILIALGVSVMGMDGLMEAARSY